MQIFFNISIGSCFPEVYTFPVVFTSTEVSVVIICKLHKVCPPTILTKTFLDSLGVYSDDDHYHIKNRKTDKQRWFAQQNQQINSLSAIDGGGY